MFYTMLANGVLVLHLTFVLFVVATVPGIFLGAVFNWGWVRLYWLRVLHLLGICIVAAETWVGVICPLTKLEMWLREQGQQGTYAESFIEYWLQRLLYWDLPSWVFVVAYTLFALLVVSTWHLVPPVRNSK